MTAAQLAALNGMVAAESAARARAGDNRDKAVIADAILWEITAPSLEMANDRLERMLWARLAAD